MSDIAIKVENLSKYYKLGVINNGTLFRDIQSYMARLRGKEDPHAKLGNNYDDNAEGFWALKDLNFEIRKGDRVGIIGHNGAGKSTLLKVLSQITSPTEGFIKLNGRIASLLEVGTGFHPELTGRENIYMNGAILGMKKAEIDKKVEQIIEFSEIGKHIDTPVKRYSSGMYVRLAFAVAAHLDSEILIADEVLAVGDAAFQRKALDKMNDLSTGQGRTVLFVSHNMNQIKNLCNKGIILEKGKLLRSDDNINDSISYYLGTDNNGKKLKTTSWHNDGSFYNENFCPIKMEIVDENGCVITSSLRYDKSYKLRISTNIDKIDSNVDFWIECFFGTEFIMRIEMPINDEYKLGLNNYEWTLKERTFLPGTYTISLGSSLKNIRYIIEPNQFSVFLQMNVSNENINMFKSL